MASKSGRRSMSSSSQFKSPCGRGRSPSPVRMTREQEKYQLAGLNDRLANYIDTVRSLETENCKLTLQVKSYEETSTREIGNIKCLYEQELADARRLLDEQAKEKAQLQIDVTRNKNEAGDYKAKCLQRDCDATNLEKKIGPLECELKNLRCRLEDALSQRKKFEDENRALNKKQESLENNLLQLRKEIEAETLFRVDAENRIQSMKEEAAFKDQIHRQELNETKTKIETSMIESDSRLQREYDNRLSESLREMRTDHEESARLYREEMETMFETKLKQMRDIADQRSNFATKSQDELRIVRRKTDELNQQITKLTHENNMLNKRVKELEDQLQHEQDDHQKAIDLLKADVEELREQLENQAREYGDLLSIKIALDVEIAAYRKLLESEEDRLNISTSSESTIPRSTPVRATPTRGGKRKRVSYAPESSSILQTSSDSYAVSSTAKGALEVYETDTEGKFIKLFNSGEKDMSIGGWQLRHTSDNEETTFKFHRSVGLKAGHYCTVWSSDSETTHNPPTDIVMKGQRWFKGTSMKTVLLNTKGDEMARREMKENLVKTYRSCREGGNEELFHQQTPIVGGLFRHHNIVQGEPGQQKCIMM